MVDAELLASMHAQGCSAWPDLDVEADCYAEFVCARLDPDAADPVTAMRSLRAEDLYLSCACANGDSRGLALFDAHYMSTVRAALRRMRGSDDTVSEIEQRVRERLLVATPDRRPRIADYAGRGDLHAWVKAVAVRTYLNLIRAGKREVLIGDQEVLDAVSRPESDPELAHMKRLYRIDFKEAFEQAMESLSAKQKTLLRYRHVDGLIVDELAAIYQVHRATAHRWLAEARDALATGTEERLRARLSISADEFQSIRRLVVSQLDLSISRVLGRGTDSELG